MIQERNNKFLDSIIMPQKIKKTLEGSQRRGNEASKKEWAAFKKKAGFGFSFFKKFWTSVFNTFGEIKLSLGLIFRLLFASKIGLVLAILMIAVPLTAFEAHVVNVTATIERRPCEEFEIRSMGYWKNHPENRIFPQTVGDTTVTNDAEADAVFDLPNDVMANKLKKQLLALKFDIAYFGSGDAILGGGDNTTLSELAAAADAALLADPQVNDTLTFYHNLIEEIITSEIISTCDLFLEGEEFQSFGTQSLDQSSESEGEDDEDVIDDDEEEEEIPGEGDEPFDPASSSDETPADEQDEPEPSAESTPEPQPEPESEPTPQETTPSPADPAPAPTE